MEPYLITGWRRKTRRVPRPIGHRGERVMLVEDSTGYVISRHPSMESACAENRRIFGVRLQRGLAPLATRIVVDR